jgi:hypothetical protein
MQHREQGVIGPEKGGEVLFGELLCFVLKRQALLAHVSAYQCPVFGIEVHGSAGGFASMATD